MSVALQAPRLHQVEVCAPETVLKLSRTLYELERSYRRLRRSIAKELGFSQMELTALLAVGDGPNVTPGVLVDELGLTSGAVTSIIDRLSAAGYLQRKAHPQDGRSVLVFLTTRGKEALETIWSRQHAALEEVADEAPCLVRSHALGCLKNAAHIIAAGARTP